MKSGSQSFLHLTKLISAFSPTHYELQLEGTEIKTCEAVVPKPTPLCTIQSTRICELPFLTKESKKFEMKLI